MANPKKAAKYLCERYLDDEQIHTEKSVCFDHEPAVARAVSGILVYPFGRVSSEQNLSIIESD